MESMVRQSSRVKTLVGKASHLGRITRMLIIEQRIPFDFNRNSVPFPYFLLSVFVLEVLVFEF